jgi:ferrochelatase
MTALAETDMRFDKLRVFYNHPGFIDPMARYLRQALAAIPADRRHLAEVIFTAHSIPLSMARRSAYERQLREASRLVSELAGVGRYRLAWQSRSGPPHIPWLEPDVSDVLHELHDAGVQDIVVVPIGFISDHLEVLFDLDLEARETAESLGMHLTRVPTVGTDPEFVVMIRELIAERLTERPVRRYLGSFGPNHDACPLNCCRLGEEPTAALERATA